MPYASPSNLRTLVWTLSVGTALDGYGVTKLVDGDPSFPLWITETSIDLRSDQGSALPLAGLVLVHHNFAATTTLRLQMHADTATWGGSTSVDVSVDVGAWNGRFAPHTFIDLTEITEATRTKRYIRLTNTDANSTGIKIGEIVPVIAVQSLGRGLRVGLRTRLNYGRSVVSGKKGPVYVHDRRTRDRGWFGGVALDSADKVLFDAWQDDSYGVRPFVCWPLNDIDGEPIYARFVSPTYQPTLQIPNITESPFEIEELSCGEAY